jgi:hypothetical protein
MSRQERRATDVVPLPFALPPAFLPRLGYRFERNLVGVYWEPLGDEAVWDDGVHSYVGADRYVYQELSQNRLIRAWLWEHEINLGSSDEPPTHWLLVERARNLGYIRRLPGARDKVRTQRINE